MTVTFSSTIPVEKKTIVVPYVDTNAKVTNFFPFWTIGISMYQNNMLPYFIITSTFSPQASSFFPFGAFQTDFNTPCYLIHSFFHWAGGALPAGATLLGWPNYGVDGRVGSIQSIPLFHRGFGSLGDMSSFVGRFHRGFGSLGDMSSFVGRFHWWSCGRPTLREWDSLLLGGTVWPSSDMCQTRTTHASFHRFWWSSFFDVFSS